MPDHHRQPPGDEPLTARSPLRLRAVLAGIALVWAGAAAVLFVVLGSRNGGALNWSLAVVCLVIVAVSAIDLLVIARRTRS
ncbi:DUF6343 family protein [Actinomadura rudentiformis]|uniref:Uncharacterized protein n=1 Tax=Actinomadura rudentiformis TaxID=359158 RepID=A0A6H9Y5I8_9ACTN|nr:DUF6343 family protein [Actinomadura rudentiformis]KAB2339208.1 hypothetical protein F8566_48870 [Actinomadura rudentiformis]